MRECIDDAMKQLDRTGAKQHKGIHEARKRCKEIRAVLRLARRPLSAHYRGENEAFRDVARGLASSRDAQAAVESWDALRERFGERLATVGDVIRQGLVARHDALLAEAVDMAASLASAQKALSQAR
ncbi:MAG: CHAD domain-containing protein, partial [Ectothiorhodospiraceae bacterium]